jgi:hypothetical protein
VLTWLMARVAAGDMGWLGENQSDEPATGPLQRTGSGGQGGSEWRAETDAATRSAAGPGRSGVVPPKAADWPHTPQALRHETNAPPDPPPASLGAPARTGRTGPRLEARSRRRKASAPSPRNLQSRPLLTAMQSCRSTGPPLKIEGLGEAVFAWPFCYDIKVKYAAAS